MTSARILLPLAATLLAITPAWLSAPAAGLERDPLANDLPELPVVRYEDFELRYRIPPLRPKPRLQYGINLSSSEVHSPQKTEAAEAINAEQMRRFQKQRRRTGATLTPFPALLYPSKVEQTLAEEDDAPPAA